MASHAHCKGVCRNSCFRSERGIALLLTIFVIAFAMIIVVELMHTARNDQYQFRAFSEGVQGDYILKSALSFGQVLLNLRRLNGQGEDWLNDIWSIAPQALGTLPISGFTGTVRLHITDECSKIDLNAIGGPLPNPGTTSSQTITYMNALKSLFTDLGMGAATYRPEDFRTPGNQSYEPATQVAVIRDYLDKDDRDFSGQDYEYEADGIESHADPALFPNAPLPSLAEVLNIPGITAERLAALAPYVRVSTTDPETKCRVNINTADPKVLKAIGILDTQLTEVMTDRIDLTPIGKGEISNYLPGSNSPAKALLDVASKEFSVVARVESASSRRWLRALVSVSPGVSERSNTVRAIEIY